MRVLMLIAAMGFLWGRATDTPPKEYKPTEVQLLRLQVKHKDAELARMRFQQAQRDFEESVMALQAEGEKVRVENKWESEVVFNADTLTFAPPPKPPVVVGKQP